jgi:hypothetical protein
VFRSSYKKEKKKEEAVMCRIRRETEQSSDYPEAVSVRQSGGRKPSSRICCVFVSCYSVLFPIIIMCQCVIF